MTSATASQIAAAAARLLRQHLPPLSARLRGRIAEALAKDLVLSRAIGEEILDARDDDALLALIDAVMLRIETAEAASEELRAEFAAWDTRHSAAASDAERKELIRERLRAIATDSRSLKGDLAAVKRHLGRDVLLERSDAAIHRIVIEIELGLGFLGLASEALLGRTGDVSALREALVSRAGLAEFLAARFQSGDRWQNRLAAVEGLARLLRPLLRAGVLPEAGAVLAAQEAALACAEDPDEHPWVRGGSLQLLLAVAREEGMRQLERRLLEPERRKNRTDFLVRRIAVDLAGDLPPAQGVPLLEALIRANDPSEHVRMGLADAAASLSWSIGLGLLRPLAGLDATIPGTIEQSPRVRAAALIAARKVASLACAAPLESKAPAREITGIMAVKRLEQESARISRRHEDVTGEIRPAAIARGEADYFGHDIKEAFAAAGIGAGAKPVSPPAAPAAPGFDRDSASASSGPRAIPSATPRNAPTDPAIEAPPAAPTAAALLRGDDTGSSGIRARPAAFRGPLDPRVDQAGSLLLEVLDGERDPMVLEIACEELARLAMDLAATGFGHVLTQRAPRWISALLTVRTRPRDPPSVHEAASAAAEIIDRELDPARRAWTDFLRTSIARIRPGRDGFVALRDAAALPRLPEAAALLETTGSIAPGDRGSLSLGRMLADLSRRSWGLGLTVRPGGYRVWRGEHFKTRLWRVLHEVRAPAPNKRMNVEHTSGRVYPGELRAHPGWMEEITATVVPGERVFVDFEGGWGRHLPTVDDLLGVVEGAPVRIFSSHGLTTLSPPSDVSARLKNYADVSWRYAALASMRLASLGSQEPRERRAWLEHLETRYGIRARFTSYAYASVPGSERLVSPHLRALFPTDPVPGTQRIEAVA